MEDVARTDYCMFMGSIFPSAGGLGLPLSLDAYFSRDKQKKQMAEAAAEARPRQSGRRPSVVSLTELALFFFLRLGTTGVLAGPAAHIAMIGR